MTGQAVDRPDQELRSITEGWADAERQGNAAFMEPLLADDFIAIGPRGFVLTKEQWLERFTSGSLKYESLEWDETNVRAYGDAAVVTGRQRQKVNYQGQAMESELRTTLVWIKQDGRWLLANAQMSPVLGIPGQDPPRRV